MTRNFTILDYSTPVTADEAQSILRLTPSDYGASFVKGDLPSTAQVRVYPPCRTNLHTVWDLIHYALLTRFPSKNSDWTSQVVDRLLDDMARDLEDRTGSDDLPNDWYQELSIYAACACQLPVAQAPKPCCVAFARKEVNDILRLLTDALSSFFGITRIEDDRFATPSVGLCFTKPVRGSTSELTATDGRDEPTHTSRIQEQEQSIRQQSARAPWFAVDLVQSHRDIRSCACR
jgi:hypothetical protein